MYKRTDFMDETATPEGDYRRKNKKEHSDNLPQRPIAYLVQLNDSCLLSFAC